MNGLMQKLPKRVLKVGDMYLPQVWLIWWHGIFEGDAVSTLKYEQFEDAVWVLEHRWERKKEPRSVVWRG